MGLSSRFSSREDNFLVLISSLIQFLQDKMKLAQLLRTAKKVPKSYSSKYYLENTNESMNQWNKGPGIGFPSPLGGKGFGDFETHPGLMPLYVCLRGFTVFLVWFCSRSLFTSPEVDWAKGKMNPGQTPQDAYRYKQYRFNNDFINCDGVEADPKTQCQSPVIPAVTAQE